VGESGGVPRLAHYVQDQVVVRVFSSTKAVSGK